MNRDIAHYFKDFTSVSQTKLPDERMKRSTNFLAQSVLTTLVGDINPDDKEFHL
jgi:hypothetical protein